MFAIGAAFGERVAHAEAVMSSTRGKPAKGVTRGIFRGFSRGMYHRRQHLKVTRAWQVK